tara:strand:+ start:7741 stop:7917 length:177 start_codon:yes stop_codon:yes gene_type:complete
MELTDKKIEQILRQPIIENRINKSKDGKYIIHRTVITDIKPTKYYDAVLNGTAKVEEE